MRKKVILSSIIALCLLTLAVFYFNYQVYYSHGDIKNDKSFEIKKGEGNAEIAQGLQQQGLILNKIYFYYYVKSQGLINKMLPGIYKLSGNMTIPEIAHVITNPEARKIKITFPEGWDSKKMADRLKENNLPGDDFLALNGEIDKFRDKYEFLSDTHIKNLDGYLFPDTYYFPTDASAETIIKMMLNDFGDKVGSDIGQNISKQNKDLYGIIVMASLIQGEVKSPEEMKIVSGIFWKRLEINMPLQSDTAYVTYDAKGLPASPISNPGIDAITAAAYPETSSYLYFLSDPETGKTLFAKTLDEQNANKTKAGL